MNKFIKFLLILCVVDIKIINADCPSGTIDCFDDGECWDVCITSTVVSLAPETSGSKAKNGIVNIATPIPKSTVRSITTKSPNTVTPTTSNASITNLQLLNIGHAMIMSAYAFYMNA